MDRTEQKETDTTDIRKLTKFQKEQVVSLVDRFPDENEEIKKGRLFRMPQVWQGTSPDYECG